ncbi:tRNA (adenosine(37)-N6)-threonylcarbamoyltransferase complex ATPase subunit type 1 TsaE [Leuconostoc rapi]|uniref:tRNA (adenosine(37)-N6)-threonylcarbamoyltransferase complex ATPase subunit type 1 TsaE n=1 Tax=Leuconostoc rapi TaxID=1406906 RepID=UPI00195AFEF7|nr:tRNA (adenosine(37)-N6)-threonylcarbamoyltransferase complex ATPase subunit type 1 TsaE [Leuconostoc rapi]MBM7434766.1 tRNA threonylcarbamoyladenosine biosynthesis protein TsaE [Leuconostoc rapi]
MKEILTNNREETQQFAVKVANLSRPGLVIALHGDLGAGKTTFTQGYARALGVTARVKSPTFNIMNTYNGLDFPIYHFDAYRLEETGAQDQGFEDYVGTDGVTLIEWPEYMADLLPNDRLTLHFFRGDGDDDRIIRIEGVGQCSELEVQL